MLTEPEEHWLESTLAQNPAAGNVVSGTGGVRKLRVALRGRGKSGGARVIYYFRGARQRVYLILAYRKNTKLNLTGAERRVMRTLVAKLESEP